MKKAWLYKEAWTTHAASGGFIAIMNQLRQTVPQKDYAEAEPGISQQFFLGILDGDIVNYMESNVPPVSLEQVSFVRTLVCAQPDVCN